MQSGVEVYNTENKKSGMLRPLIVNCRDKNVKVNCCFFGKPQ